MFLGEYKHQLDEKGRVAVPSKFRGSLKSGSIVTRGLDNCLFLFSKDEWKKIAEKLTQLTILKKDARALARHMFANASEVSTDKQGRILIPDYLRKFAKINKNIIFAGVYNRVEIWEESQWERYKERTDKYASDIAERMSDLDI